MPQTRSTKTSPTTGLPYSSVLSRPSAHPRPIAERLESKRGRLSAAEKLDLKRERNRNKQASPTPAWRAYRDRITTQLAALQARNDELELTVLSQAELIVNLKAGRQTTDIGNGSTQIAHRAQPAPVPNVVSASLQHSIDGGRRGRAALPSPPSSSLASVDSSASPGLESENGSDQGDDDDQQSDDGEDEMAPVALPRSASRRALHPVSTSPSTSTLSSLPSPFKRLPHSPQAHSSTRSSPERPPFQGLVHPHASLSGASYASSSSAFPTQVWTGGWSDTGMGMLTRRRDKLGFQYC